MLQILCQYTLFKWTMKVVYKQHNNKSLDLTRFQIQWFSFSCHWNISQFGRNHIFFKSR